MKTAVRAGIDLFESTLRYAEVEQYGARYRLLRLGSCSFEFNVAQELLRTDYSEHLQTIADALRDIFTGSVAPCLQMSLHPSDCYSFFAPLPVHLPAADRKQRLKQEARLVTAAPTAANVHVVEEALFTETVADDPLEWFHVLALPDQTAYQLDRVVQQAPQQSYLPRLSMQGAANILARLVHDEAVEDLDEAPVSLLIGWYPSHVEYAVCEGARWRFSHFTPAGPPIDCAYFAVALLRRLRLAPEQVGRIYLYGEEVDAASFEVLAEVLGPTPAPLDALRVIDIDRNNLVENFGAEIYVPCIGVLL